MTQCVKFYCSTEVEFTVS